MKQLAKKGTSSYMGSFKQKIAFEMPQEKYVEIFNNKVDAIGNNPGHGFANVTVKPEGITGTFRMNLPYEVQCSVMFDEDINCKDAFYENLKLKYGWAENSYITTVKKRNIVCEKL